MGAVARKIPQEPRASAPYLVEPPLLAKPSLSPEVKMYLAVFGALILLTGLAIVTWSLHLPAPLGPILAISIAVIKASLIVCFFMHLLWERWAVNALLVLVSIHCAGLLFGIYFSEEPLFRDEIQHPVYTDPGMVAKQH